MYEYLFGPAVVLAFGIGIGLYGYLVRVHGWTWLVAGTGRLSEREVARIAGGFILSLGVVITAYGLFFRTTNINSVWVTHSFTLAVVGLTLRPLYQLTAEEPPNSQNSIAPADD